MSNIDEKNIAKDIFYLNEDGVYKIIEEFNNQVVDKSLVYCFVKAFFVHTVKVYLEKNNVKKFNFDDIYLEYKDNLKIYYKTNNPDIQDDLLDQVMNFFDNSFGLIDSVELQDIYDSYEFRHYTINVFELLRIILEKKSREVIRENIFDKYIKNIIEEKENLLDYLYDLFKN